MGAAVRVSISMRGSCTRQWRPEPTSARNGRRHPRTVRRVPISLTRIATVLARSPTGSQPHCPGCRRPGADEHQQHRLFSHRITAGSRSVLGRRSRAATSNCPRASSSCRSDAEVTWAWSAYREIGSTSRLPLTRRHFENMDRPRQSATSAPGRVRRPTTLLEADPRGTGLRTRKSSRVAAKRLVPVGDAAGYVEPFTGEG